MFARPPTWENPTSPKGGERNSFLFVLLFLFLVGQTYPLFLRSFLTLFKRLGCTPNFFASERVTQRFVLDSARSFGLTTINTHHFFPHFMTPWQWRVLTGSNLKFSYNTQTRSTQSHSGAPGMDGNLQPLSGSHSTKNLICDWLNVQATNTFVL